VVYLAHSSFGGLTDMVVATPSGAPSDKH
jgi:hypothetical protein